MLYRLLANTVVVGHALFIGFVVFGGFLAWRWRWVAAVHLPCAAWGILIEYGHWVCPLTPLENHLRTKAGAEGYHGGFIEHYIMPVIYPGGLTPQVQVVLGTAVLVVNVCVYTFVIRRWLKGS
ncbi:MAG TPA: DUF2784 domain-containing protein [Gemmatimonadales bacterium]|jgi:hypothetical protein|nr:DUF2784 domain-containing protein [Gemmatimonadales bacterium]